MNQKGVWYVETVNSKEGWSQLPKYDSEYLEKCYLEGGKLQEVFVRGTHDTVNFPARTIRETYIESSKFRRLIRGTWYWKHASGKSVPFEEGIALMIEEWSATTIEFDPKGVSYLDIGEPFGIGNGKYVIKAVLAESKGSSKEHKAGDTDVQDNTQLSVVFSLEWSSLISLSKGSIVEKGVQYEEGNTTDRYRNHVPVHLAFVVHGIGEAMFAESSMLPSLKDVVEKMKANTFDCTKNKRRDDPPPATSSSTFSQQSVTVSSSSSYHTSTTSVATSAIVDYEGDYLKSDGPVKAIAAPVHSGGECATGSATANNVEYANVIEENAMIDFIPIEWFACIHGDELDVTRQMKTITMDNIPLIRQFGNSAVMDILLYQTPEFQIRIVSEVVRKINNAFEAYCRNNPKFNGTCSIIGHSLGSVISFDILCFQQVVTAQPVGQSGGLGTPIEHLPCDINRFQPHIGIDVSERNMQLSFIPHSFFALGSPIGMFYTIRSKGQPLPVNFHFPTCKRIYNIFHPLDPVAYRIEPLLDTDLATVDPYLIDHHRGMRTVYKFKKISSDLSKGIENLQSDISKGITTFQNVLSTSSSWFSSSSSSLLMSSPAKSAFESSVEESKKKEGYGTGSTVSNPSPDRDASTLKMKCNLRAAPEQIMECFPVNEGNRLDYMLQETPWETTNPYVAALGSHSSYFENLDIARFLVAKMESKLENAVAL